MHCLGKSILEVAVHWFLLSVVISLGHFVGSKNKRSIHVIVIDTCCISSVRTILFYILGAALIYTFHKYYVYSSTPGKKSISTVFS